VEGVKNRILNVKPNDQAFTTRFGAAVTVASGEIGIILVPQKPTAPSPEVTALTWREFRAEDPLMVQLVYDTKMPATWVSLFGATEEKRAGLLHSLDVLLPIIAIADLKRKARGYKDPNALIRLALALENPRDREARMLLEEGLTSKKAPVRIAAASAMGILKWPSFEKRLTEALPGETDESAQAVLRAAIEACETSGRPEPSA
jgi:hypothetical protein